MPWLRTVTALLLTATLSHGADWPQWLGPNRDGGSTEKVAPWKETPKRLWSVLAGDGHGAAVVAGGRVFLHAKAADKPEEELIAYDAVKGTKLWSKTYPRAAFESPFGAGPRATPVVADGKIYTFGVTGVLSCFDVENGKQLWQVDTLAKFKVPNLTFGLSSSPLIDGDRVIVEVGTGASIVAFDRANGEVAWKSLKDPASYASAVILGTGKDRQLVALTGENVVALNPVDGKEIWKFPFKDLINESSTTPLRIGDLILASSVTIGSVGLKIDRKDGSSAVSAAWKNMALACYFATPVVVGKNDVYMVTGRLLKPQASLRCVDMATGKERWNHPKVGKYHASLLRTGDNKLLMLEEAGSLVLIDTDPKEYRELARSKVCEFTWAHPALANGKLYVRDRKTLTCLQMSP